MRMFGFSRAVTVWRRRGLHVAAAGVLGSTVACSPSSLVDVQTPSTVVDPSTVTTVAGAIALRTAALVEMMYTATSAPGDGIIGQSGSLTDELTCVYCNWSNIDWRKTDRSNSQSYADIHASRIKARLAREALLGYSDNSPSAPRAWQGEMYALEGFTVVWLAELYCSGVPLSSVPLKGTATPTRGFTTQELFERAVVLFDSAMVVGQDSATYVNLARVGKARALLGLGRFAAADSAAAEVPTDFVYRLQADSSGTTWGYNLFPSYVTYYAYRAQDHEGGTGLVWSADPRTGVVSLPGSPDYQWPAKYNVNALGQIDPTSYSQGVPIRLADGLEARLIQSEAALARGDPSWLATLNTLRSTCLSTTPCAPVPGLTSASLPPLSDPGTDTGRVSLVMRERAMWLYLTAHREGDLRRLTTVYHRDPNTLWPTGAYSSPNFDDLGIGGNPYMDGTPYGTSTVFNVPSTEQANDPLYGGCYNLNP